MSDNMDCPDVDALADQLAREPMTEPSGGLREALAFCAESLVGLSHVLQSIRDDWTDPRGDIHQGRAIIADTKAKIDAALRAAPSGGAGLSAGGDDTRTTNYVAGFAFSETEDRVALILKVRPDWQRGRLNGIGGHIEAGETPLAAMQREFEEETGGEADWTPFATLRGGNDFAVHFFRGVTADPLESLTDETVLWVDPNDLPENVLPNLRWLIPMARAHQSRDWPFKIEERYGGAGAQQAGEGVPGDSQPVIRATDEPGGTSPGQNDSASPTRPVASRGEPRVTAELNVALDILVRLDPWTEPAKVCAAQEHVIRLRARLSGRAPTPEGGTT